VRARTTRDQFSHAQPPVVHRQLPLRTCSYLAAPLVQPLTPCFSSGRGWRGPCFARTVTTVTICCKQRLDFRRLYRDPTHCFVNCV
jgi:hypothetical protein